MNDNDVQLTKQCEFDELNHEEQRAPRSGSRRDRLHLERRVERAFYEAGSRAWLQNIKLSKTTHSLLIMAIAEKLANQFGGRGDLSDRQWKN